MDFEELRNEVRALKGAIKHDDDLIYEKGKLLGIEVAIRAMDDSDFSPKDFWGKHYDMFLEIKALLNIG